MFPHSLFAPAILPAHGEGSLVDAFLGPDKGVFVEVGANHPVKGSQTWGLEQRGWSGLLVEPLAERAAELRIARRAIVEEVACCPPELHGTIGLFHVSNYQSTLSVDRGDAGVRFKETRDVPLRTLDSLIEKAGIAQVDFLSVDVEGFEAEVLRGTALQRWRPRLVLVEDKARSFDVHRVIKAAGYKRVLRTGLNSWYVPNATPFPVSPRGRLQLLRKYVLAVPFHQLAHGLRLVSPVSRNRNR
jgi:FkbM family methyltransferase